MKFLLIVIFTSSGFSAEFNSREACNKTLDSIVSVKEVHYVWCTPKGKTDLNKMNDDLYQGIKELFNGD